MANSITNKLDGWNTWHPTAITFFVSGAMFGLWATQIPAFKERLGLDPVMLSLILLLLGIGTVIAMVLSTWAIRRIGVVSAIRVNAIAICVLAVLVPLAPNTISLAAVVFLFGASDGGLNVAMNAYGSEIERRSGRDYMSSFHGMWSLGGLMGTGIGALLLRILSPAIEALVISVALVVLFLWAQRGLFSPPQQVATDQVPTRTRFALAGPALLLGVVAIFAFSGEGIVLNWAAVYMQQGLAASSDLALMGYTVLAGTMAIMRFAGDGMRRRFNARTLVWVGGLIAALGFIIGPLSRNPALMIAGCALVGAGLANVVPVLFSLAGRLPRPEVQIATVSTMGFGGLLAVPPLLGLIGQHFGLGAIFFAGAVGAAGIASLALLGIRGSVNIRSD